MMSLSPTIWNYLGTASYWRRIDARGSENASSRSSCAIYLYPLEGLDRCSSTRSLLYSVRSTPIKMKATNTSVNVWTNFRAGHPASPRTIFSITFQGCDLLHLHAPCKPVNWLCWVHISPQLFCSRYLNSINMPTDMYYYALWSCELRYYGTIPSYCADHRVYSF